MKYLINFPILEHIKYEEIARNSKCEGKATYQNKLTLQECADACKESSNKFTHGFRKCDSSYNYDKRKYEKRCDCYCQVECKQIVGSNDFDVFELTAGKA